MSDEWQALLTKPQTCKGVAMTATLWMKRSQNGPIAWRLTFTMVLLAPYGTFTTLRRSCQPSRARTTPDQGSGHSDTFILRNHGQRSIPGLAFLEARVWLLLMRAEIWRCYSCSAWKGGPTSSRRAPVRSTVKTLKSKAIIAPC